MTKIIFEKIIKSDRKKVFELVTNYENFQKILPQYYLSVRSVSVRENTSLVEEHLLINGRELVMMAKHVINEPVLHEIFIVGGDAKGTHISSRYEQLAYGTKLILEIKWKINGMMKIRDFSGKKIAKEYSKIIDKFIEIVDA